MRVACEVSGGAVLIIGALVGGMAAASLERVVDRSAASDTARGELQAAVTSDGFLVAQPAAGAHRVWAVGRDGSQQHLAEVLRDGEVRVVGTSAGPTAGYQDGKRIRLSRIADGRDLGMWGTNAQHLCDGVASNDKRFAVGWLEGNGGVWIVHGPTTRPRTTTDASAGELEANEGELDAIAALDVGATEQPSWCGVASAGDKVALAWRDRDRLLLGMCTAKRCGGLTASVPMPRDNVILGMGCLRNACMIAHSNHRKTVVTYVTESGSAKWERPIETDATSVSVVGVGDNAFAVGFSNRSGGHVLRFDRKGNSTQPWRGSVGSGVPQLAWSMGHLLVAHYTNDAVTPISLKLPN